MVRTECEWCKGLGYDPTYPHLPCTRCGSPGFESHPLTAIPVVAHDGGDGESNNSQTIEDWQYTDIHQAPERKWLLVWADALPGRHYHVWQRQGSKFFDQYWVEKKLDYLANADRIRAWKVIERPREEGK